MTKKNNANSARRKLIPAVGMLAVSAMMLSSSTYAWFTMSDNVTVTGMQMKATSEGGIVVTNEDAASWGTTATAKYDGLNKSVLPTSTANTSNWYYRMSSQWNNAEAEMASGDYTPLSNLVDKQGESDTADGVYGITMNDNTQNYYLLNKFYIKSSGQELTDKNLTITKVKATGNSESTDLDKAFRVAVKIGNDVFIYAPFNIETANLTYHVGGYSGDASNKQWAEGSQVTAVKPGEGGTLNTASVADDRFIPANTATIDGETKPIEADVFLYFEGEDPDCKSSNIKTSFDALSVEITFGMANRTTGTP